MYIEHVVFPNNTAVIRNAFETSIGFFLLSILSNNAVLLCCCTAVLAFVFSNNDVSCDSCEKGGNNSEKRRAGVRVRVLRRAQRAFVRRKGAILLDLEERRGGGRGGEGGRVLT